MAQSDHADLSPIIIKLIDEEIKLYTCVCYISHFVHLKFHTESGYRFYLKNEKYNTHCVCFCIVYSQIYTI
jgi:hypothetical protein